MVQTAKKANNSTKPQFTVPGLDTGKGAMVATVLQERLVALLDLSQTLKHVHWNVVGPTFIGVHQMIDPQVDGVNAMIDATAERIATLGAAPNGLAGNLVSSRRWDDYSLGRAMVAEHLGALEMVYVKLITSHRLAMEKVSDSDPVSEDLLIQQTGTLELYHWFVRAHLESSSGVLSTAGSSTERQAAEAAEAAANGH